MIGRTLLAVATVAAAVVLPAQAQELPRIAVIEQGEPVEAIAIGRHPWWDAFLTELGQLGHAENENLIIERWTAAGRDDAGYAQLAQAVVATEPDVIVARGLRGLTAFIPATTEIPIVGLATFPVGFNFARPGGNVSGVDITAGFGPYHKQLQFLREALPEVTRVAWLGPRDFWDSSDIAKATREGADRLGLDLVPILVESPPGENTLRAAFASIAHDGFRALFVSSSPDMTPYAALVAELAAGQRLPAIALHQQYARSGLLMSYGPNFVSGYRRAAHLVDQILDGADLAELPIEQPTEFDFIVNLKTAAAIGVTLPPGIMLFATEIIE